jgi:hypothetical protein
MHAPPPGPTLSTLLCASVARWTPGDGSHGYLCKGSRYATPADFPDRPFGSFLYETPGDAFAHDPIEARLMGGQQSGRLNSDTGIVSPGNEEAALQNITVEVYGCRLPDDPVCGDGVVTLPEQCDLGMSGNQSLNTWGAACSVACTGFNLPACSTSGDCPVDPAPAPIGQDFPGKTEVRTRPWAEASVGAGDPFHPSHTCPFGCVLFCAGWLNQVASMDPDRLC